MTSVLISTPRVVRAPLEGVDVSLSWLDDMEPHKGATRLYMEPTFLDFKTASANALELLFTVPDQFDPEYMVFSVHYTRQNANSFKGYLLDLAKYQRDRGYVDFVSLHLPFESYGAPVVGSTLLLVFGKSPLIYVPKKKQVYPADIWPDLLYHTHNGRALTGVVAGGAQMLGMLDSRVNFFPGAELWGPQMPCETRSGTTTEASILGPEYVRKVFGVSSFQGYDALQYLTPAAIIETFKGLRPAQMKPSPSTPK